MFPRYSWWMMVLLALTGSMRMMVRGSFLVASRSVVRWHRGQPEPKGFDLNGCIAQTASTSRRASTYTTYPQTSMKSLTVELRIPTSDVMEEMGGLLYSTIEDETSPSDGGAGERAGAGAGAVICLDGDLGAGKTAFSRGFVRAATGDWSLRVTSPTYLLSNAYRTSRCE